MRRFRAIAAVLMLVLTLPLAHAGAIGLRAKAVPSDCCRQRAQRADACCEGLGQACCGAQAPAEAAVYPGQSAAQLLPPPMTSAVDYADRKGGQPAQRLGMRVRAEHSPPGLLIVATTILRI